jgi:hypothetical protein
MVDNWLQDLPVNQLCTENAAEESRQTKDNRSNADVGGRTVELSEFEHAIRGKGYLKSINDLGDIVLKTSNGTPVLLRDVARVGLGPDERRGITELNGEGEVASGIVLQRFGVNALAVIHNVKKRFAEIASSLPKSAALIYGDGAITPAISVLSALEGLNMVTPALQPYVVPATVAILLALFAIQSQGTAKIGHFFGPGDAGLVPCHRDDGDYGHRAASFCVRRPRSHLRFVLPVLTRGHRLLGAGRGVSLRHRRRGTLCRYGPFRQGTDQTCLVRHRVYKPDPELRGTGGARA